MPAAATRPITAEPVVDAGALVAYAEGSVVSRTVLKNASGSLTVFAFDKDEALSEHSAPFDALIQVLDGEAEISLAGAPHRLKAGQMIVMPAMIPHAVKAVARFKMALFLLKVKEGA